MVGLRQLLPLLLLTICIMILPAPAHIHVRHVPHQHTIRLLYKVLSLLLLLVLIVQLAAILLLPELLLLLLVVLLVRHACMVWLWPHVGARRWSCLHVHRAQASTLKAIESWVRLPLLLLRLHGWLLLCMVAVPSSRRRCCSSHAIIMVVLQARSHLLVSGGQRQQILLLVLSLLLLALLLDVLSHGTCLRLQQLEASGRQARLQEHMLGALV